jgi:hypothetical protein
MHTSQGKSNTCLRKKSSMSTPFQRKRFRGPITKTMTAILPLSISLNLCILCRIICTLHFPPYRPYSTCLSSPSLSLSCPLIPLRFTSSPLSPPCNPQFRRDPSPSCHGAGCSVSFKSRTERRMGEARGAGRVTCVEKTSTRNTERKVYIAQ